VFRLKGLPEESIHPSRSFAGSGHTFISPFQLHFQLANLLEQLLGKLFIGRCFRLTCGKEILQLLFELLFPLGNLGGMYTMLLSQNREGYLLL